jgi:hypothetical protein
MYFEDSLGAYATAQQLMELWQMLAYAHVDGEDGRLTASRVVLNDNEVIDVIQCFLLAETSTL